MSSAHSRCQSRLSPACDSANPFDDARLPMFVEPSSRTYPSRRGGQRIGRLRAAPRVALVVSLDTSRKPPTCEAAKRLPAKPTVRQTVMDSDTLQPRLGCVECHDRPPPI